MAVNEAVSAYSTTAASNTPAGTDTVGPNLDDQLRDMKKNTRAVAESFKGLGDGGFPGAIRLDDSASPSWTVSIRGTGANINLFDVDDSAGTTAPYFGASPASTFTQQHAVESTASARSTIMGSYLAAAATTEGTATASHNLSAQGLGIPIGTVAATVGSSVDDGWLALNADTIGALSASATHANNIFEILYKKVWNSVADSWAPVEGGRGASANADWSANKYLRLPDARGRSLIGSGQGYDDISSSSTLTSRTHASFGGEETHLLTSGESGLRAHIHNVPARQDAQTGGNDANRLSEGNTNGNAVTFTKMTSAAASDAISAHANMSPWLAMTYQIKY